MPKEKKTAAETQRAAENIQTTAPAEPPQCHIHDSVNGSMVDYIRQNVCIAPAEYPLTEFEGKHYCLFHLPTPKKDAEKFNEIFYERLDKIDQACAAIEAEFPGDEKKQKSVKEETDISYNFRYVWFPQKVILSQRIFSAFASFYSATFSADADFDATTFSADASFSSATFSADAYFNSAIFSARAYFNSAIFSARAFFNSAIFSARAFFDSAIFSADVTFAHTKFSKTERTSFYKATFEKDAYFDRARFRNEVLFNSNFGKDSDILFRGTFFAKKTEFQYCAADGYVRFANLRMGREAFLDFTEATFEKASRISFHTCPLRPGFFVNIDSRKFVLTDIDWGKSIKESLDNKNIEAELDSLEKLGIKEQKKRLLEIACRNLAVNAEENNRYEEAAKLRYMAMETRRLENKGIWRILDLHLLYKWSSGYGERWRRALLVLLTMLFLFGIFYNSPFANFESPEKKTAGVAADNVPPQYYKMNNAEGFVHSFSVAILRPEPKAADTTTKAFVILETILAPLQAALLALAIRRKFMR